VRIISKFKDYYDCLQTHDSLIFQRKQTVIKYDGTNLEWDRDLDTIADNFNIIIIGFCGKLYPALYTTKMVVGGSYVLDKVFYEYNDVMEEIIDNSEETKRYYQYFWIRNKQKRRERKLKDLQLVFKKDYSRYSGHFLKYTTPIFLAEKDCLTINPQLSAYSFYKKFDVNQAFQEVEMYLGSILCANEDRLPPVSNNNMIEAKGFNLKSSFRKPKKEH